MNRLLEKLKILLNKLMDFFKEEPEIIKIVPPPHISRIKDWAKAIEIEESSKPPKLTDRNKRNNNPGNIKLSSYTKTLGSIEIKLKGITGVDKDNFCIFENYDSGFKALCQFLTDAANNKLKPYRNCSLLEFTRIYAEPPNDNYANGVANKLGVSVNDKIKILL